MPYLVLIIVLQFFEEEEKAGCFAIIVLQMYCYYKYSVALPHGAMVGLQCVIVIFPDHTHLLSMEFSCSLAREERNSYFSFH